MDNQRRDDLVDSKYGISDLLNLAELYKLFTEFVEATGFSVEFLDHPAMNVLFESGQRSFCTPLHCPNAGSDLTCIKGLRHFIDSPDIPEKPITETCGKRIDAMCRADCYPRQAYCQPGRWAGLAQSIRP